MSENLIIVKKKKKHGGHHGGAWKVAYADFVTAMMALFIVMWVLGQSDHTVEAVAHYFKDPVGFSDKGKNVLDSASHIIDTKIDELRQKEIEKEKLKKMGDAIMKELSGDPSFDGLLEQVEVQIVEEGLRIEMLDSENIFFEVGTAKLNDNARKLLTRIGDQLARLPNKIVIEGHTDSRPYSGSGAGYTNFELSSERANSARSALTFSKLEPWHIEEVRGYADRRLRDKNDPFNLINRRISIIIKYSGNK
jgi:chemotaxis protein MotB